MDTSEEYIKMCEKAKEIESERDRFFDGDTYIRRNSNGKVMQFVFCSDCNVQGLQGILEGDIWLPRQDQLQEMMEYKPSDNPVSFLCMFGNWVIHTSNSDIGWKNRNYWEGTFKTMEQLTLGLVMWVKYRKKWNGEEWVA